MSDGLLTYLEVAARLGCSESTVKRYAQSRRLKVIDLGHRTKRVRPVDVDRFVEKMSTGGMA